jgi:hypothetical protein
LVASSNLAPGVFSLFLNTSGPTSFKPEAITIGNLLGPHYAPLASLGRFNSHLKNAILIFADEAIWGGNKREVGALKALITEPKLIVI